MSQQVKGRNTTGEREKGVASWMRFRQVIPRGRILTEHCSYAGFPAILKVDQQVQVALKVL